MLFSDRTGDEGSDTFVLGTFNKVFYDDGNRQIAGTSDYAVITDLRNSRLYKNLTVRFLGKPLRPISSH